ncbi:MAG: lipoprotein-releasing ABC transporter permease subunit [Holosporales bacterium]|jgi:lipoprotein-releasing system permease protein|nr:lipoprotein-releasing ABC transporter permease subunit [Holosporales bacterium]
MFTRFISFRYLLSNNGFASVVTWFSFIGIALGVATLVIVTSVMNGFKEDLLSRIIGMKGHIVVSASGQNSISEYQKVVKKLLENKDVIYAIPTIEKQVVLMSKNHARGVIVHSFSKGDLPSKKLISENIKVGNLDSFFGENIFMGSRMAEILHINVGDTISIMLPGGIMTPFGSLPKQASFIISGIFEAGMIDYDKNIIIMPLDTAQKFFGMQKSIGQIDVIIRNINETENIVQWMHKNLGQKYWVLDWKHSDSSIFHAVTVEKNVMILILSIIVLVAAFNIISGLSMLTNNKTKDIAILRTMGATKSSILKIFFTIGSCIGAIGTFTGVSLGLLVSLNIDRIKMFLERFLDSPLFSEEIYFLSQIPSKTDFTEVLAIVLFSLGLSFMATIYPARKAAGLDPAQALRV